MSVKAMERRKIIEIDEKLCTGCGDCIPGCAEGALQIIDGKARLISDLFCDGLGACIGHCPVGAMNITEREAEPYDERIVMEEMVKKGSSTVAAHLRHLQDHGAKDFYRVGISFLKERGITIPGFVGDEASSDAKNKSALAACGSSPGGCPGSTPRRLSSKPSSSTSASVHKVKSPKKSAHLESHLENWPVQIRLAPVNAPYFKDADLLFAADCTAFASASFHEELAKGRIVLIGCPKLDDAGFYAEKITRIVSENDVRSVTVAHMTVPCCFGLVALVRSALNSCRKSIPIEEVTVSLDGELDWHALHG